MKFYAIEDCSPPSTLLKQEGLYVAEATFRDVTISYQNIRLSDAVLSVAFCRIDSYPRRDALSLFFKGVLSNDKERPNGLCDSPITNATCAHGLANKCFGHWVDCFKLLPLLVLIQLKSIDLWR